MKILFYTFLLLSFAALAFSATYTGVININNSTNASGCTQGNGTIARDQRSLPRFEQIEISGAFDVIIRCGSEHKAIIEIDKNILHLIETTVTGTTLELATRGSICVENPIQVYLSAPVITAIRSDGANDVTITCADKYEKLSLSLEGSSDVKLQADIHILDLTLEDAASFVATSGIADIARVSASDASSATLSVRNQLTATSSDASEIYYNTTTAVINKSVYDAGEVLPISEK